MGNLDRRLATLEAPYLQRGQSTVVGAYVYGPDRRLAAVTIGQRKVERMPGETKAALAARATADMEHAWIILRDFVDARDGKP
jgi:hypothetical protein